MGRRIVNNSSGGYRLNVFYILRAAERRLHDSSLRSHDSLFMIVVHDSLHYRAAHDLALTQPLAGVRNTGSLHMTIQTAVLIQPGSNMPSNCSCTILKPVLPSFLSKILQKLVFLMSKQPEKNSSKSSALAFPCWLTFTPFIHTAVKINQAQNAFSMLNV